MPKFVCSRCGADITARARAVLGEVTQMYMPYDLHILCSKCGRLVHFKLEYTIALSGVKAVQPIPEKPHASPRDA